MVDHASVMETLSLTRYYCTIKLLIIFGTAVPGPILSHGIALNFSPILRMISITINGPVKAIIKSSGTVGIETESRCGVVGKGTSICIGDSISKAARGAYNGQSAIAHAVKLVEARGFIKARHKEAIRSSFNFVCHGFTESEVECDSAWVGGLQLD